MKLLITLLCVFLFTITSSAQDGQVYEYLTMVKINYDLHISGGAEGYEKVNIKGETEDKQYDLRAVNVQISAYEAEGWELVSAAPFSVSNGNYPGVPMYQVIMRKPKD